MSALYGTVSSNHTSKWHPEPTFRGTSSILTTCVITMGLCVWTAVHLNIPEHGEKGFFKPQFTRKIRWLFIGLFAPEVIAWVAFEQRREAKRIHREMRRILKQVDEPHFLRRWFCMSRFKRMLWKEKDFTKRKLFDDRHEWTMTHSHLVAMGGFAIDVSKIEFIAPKRYTQFTLNTEGFFWVAGWALEHIPNISEAEIRDKSKADGLAKTLVCIQATWFCVQCIVRLSQRLTISLLELNTFAHATCTLLAYVLWWDKPFNIEEPVLLHDNHAHSTAAVLLVQGMNVRYFREGIQKDEEISRAFISKPMEYSKPPKLRPGLTRLERPMEFWGIERFPTTSVRRQSRGAIPFFSRPWSQNYAYLDLSDNEIACLNLAKQTAPLSLNTFANYSLLCLRRGNWPDSFDVADPWFFCSFAFAGLSYGGIHITAWDASFPSSTQRLLWNISSSGLVCSTLTLLVLCGLVRIFDSGKYSEGSFLRRFLEMKIRWLDSHLEVIIVGGVVFLFVLPAALFYLFCRVYLVVECFITISHLPDSVFQVPQWSQYFPHIG